MTHVEDTELLQTELKVADTIGSIMEFWGFKRSVGRLWTLLYLSPEPLGAADLGERLTMSTGAVSMTLAELTKWGAVKKTWVPGERRDFYEVETSIWKLITRVLRERELALLEDASKALNAAAEVLSRKIERENGESKQRLNFILERISRLQRLAGLTELLLSAIISGDSIDPAEVREIAKGE